MNSSHLHRRRSGFTLIEVTISLLIVTGLMLAAASTVGTTAGMRRIQVAESVGHALAQDLAGEIVRCRYEDPDAPIFGPEADEGTSTRADWNDTDDFNGWSASPPLDRDGNPLPGLDGWTRTVQVAYADVGNPGLDATGGDDFGLKRITVTVTAPDGNTTAFVALRSRTGSFDHDPPIEATLVTWVGVAMQIGPNADRAVQTGVHVANQMAQTN